MKVVYIAGYGRSGSTLLDMLLSAHERVAGTSELTHVFRYWQENQPCSCGSRLRDCPFWTGVFARLDLPESVSSQRIARITRRLESWPIWISKLLFRRQLGEYRNAWTQMFHAIAAESGCETIVDSSKSSRKTLSRAALLARVCGLDVATIHLVRDPRGVAHSYLRGNNIELERGKVAVKRGGLVRVVASWVMTNLLVHGSQMFRRLPYLRVRYEDLAARPDAEIARIGHLLGCDFRKRSSPESRNVLDASHGIAGNRTRRQGTGQIVIDEQWKQERASGWGGVSWVCWPFMKKYGYQT